MHRICVSPPNRQSSWFGCMMCVLDCALYIITPLLLCFDTYALFLWLLCTNNTPHCTCINFAGVWFGGVQHSSLC